MFRGNCLARRLISVASRSQPMLGVRGVYNEDDFAKLAYHSIDKTNSILSHHFKPHVPYHFTLEHAKQLIIQADAISNSLCIATDFLGYIGSNHPSPETQMKAFKANSLMFSHLIDLNSSSAVFQKLQRILDSDIFPLLTHEEQRMVHDLYVEQLLHQTDPTSIDKVKVLQKQVEKIQNELHNDIQSLVFRVPDEFHDELRKEFKFIQLHTNRPDFVVNLRSLDRVNATSHSESLRLFAHKCRYHFFITKLDSFENLTRTRAILANAMGFESFSNFIQRQNILSEPKKVQCLLESAMEKAKVELTSEMKRLKISHMSDYRYAKQSQFAEESLNEAVFSRDKCIQGANRLAEVLFGITFKECKDIDSIERIGIHDLLKFTVHDDDTLLGTVYLDILYRPHKPSGASHHNIQSGFSKQPQISVLSVSLNEFITISDVATYFHEFGHLVHSILSKTEFQHLTGIRGPFDLTEIPSTLMEYFAHDHRVLRGLTEIDDKKLLSLISLSKRNFCFDMYELTIMALADIAFASISVRKGVQMEKGFTLSIWREIILKHGILESFVDTAEYLRSSHLVNEYAGQYYSYVFAESIASHLWHELFFANPFSPESGGKLRRMLQLGNARSPEELLRIVLPDFERKMHDFSRVYQYRA